ncbi:MAG: amidase domain-containing protein [Lachnospiraceae bacterium]|nr:amidase domain-containing protein [Lachnospiraceae bacterium]
MKKRLLSLMLIFAFILETPANVMAAYDREAAVQYAKKHAAKNTNNKEYDYYKDGDCTNFVSQCLYAGGIRNQTSISYSDLKYGVNDEKSNWYNKKYTFYRVGLHLILEITRWKTSSTWVRVYNTGTGRGLYQYLVNERGCLIAAFENGSKYSKFEDLVKTAQVGDVIQCSDNINKLTHSVIVTEKTGSDLKVCYHSNDKKDVSFYDNIWSNYKYMYVIKVK